MTQPWVMEYFGATFFSMSYIPLTAPIVQICISKCYEIRNTSIWKILIIPLCRLFFLGAPHFHPCLYFSEWQTSPKPFHHSKYTFLSRSFSFFDSDLRSPCPINIETSLHTFFRIDLPRPTFFSSSLITNWTFSSYLYSWSRPIPPVAFSFSHQLLPLSQFTFDNRLPHSNFTLNLQYTSLICFFLTAYFVSFSTAVTQTCFLFRGCG